MNSMSLKKILKSSLLFIALIGVTFFVVFKDNSLNNIVETLKSVNLTYIYVGILFMFLFICCEAINIRRMLRLLSYDISIVNGLKYAFVGFFFSSITPSASGGQPMQIYYMKKDKLPIPVTTLVLMIVTITYKMVLVILGLAVLVIRPPVVMHYLNPILFWCYLGIILNVICVWVMLALVFHPDWMHRMVAAMIDLVIRIFHWKRGIKLRERLDGAMEKYSQAAAFFKSHKIIVLQVLVITFLQRGCLFLVTVAACRSLGVTAGSIGLIVLLQGMISVAVDMLPFPGGVGISEALFLRIFTPLCGGTLALPVLIVSRGISYYTQLAICGIMSIFAYIKIGR